MSYKVTTFDDEENNKIAFWISQDFVTEQILDMFRFWKLSFLNIYNVIKINQ